tara:strand:+ start:479 stop:1243 length:765 start_codon:yes stop_codon:yes gene_type:complete
MKVSDHHLVTPLYLKMSKDMPWPKEESAFYLLSSDGLFMCRNNPFFRSSVPVRDWPAELAAHQPSIRLSYPRIPQALFEKLIGFFAIIGERHGAEAAALLAWNRSTKEVEAIVPPQEATVSKSWGGRPYPIDVSYDVPPLDPNLVLIGDIHSHVDGPAYTSKTDADDEAHRPGIHIVIGRIFTDPPEIHIEATVDGSRFRVEEIEHVIEGYDARRTSEVPSEWIEQVEVKDWYSSYSSQSTYYSSEYGTSTSYP